MVARADVEPGDIAILFRTHEQPRLFETELRKANIPYILVGSRSFFDRREVRDILSYLKLVHSGGDEISLRRIINTPPRGIGSRTVDQLLRKATDAGIPLWKQINSEPGLGDLPPRARQACQKFTDLVKGFRAAANHLGPLELTEKIIRDIGYQGEVERYSETTEEREARWDTVQEFVNAVALYQKTASEPTLHGFIEEIVLGESESDRDKEQQLKRNCVVLMTLHAAKGLEYPHVYMVGLEEGILPHHRSLKESDDVSEERRLAYVGVTRGEETLTLSMSLTRLKWGRTYESVPSRFLFEMIGAESAATRADGSRPGASGKS
jgi:DNA helicase-2/ATP-dependent DNA helicase PcrA